MPSLQRRFEGRALRSLILTTLLGRRFARQRTADFRRLHADHSWWRASEPGSLHRTAADGFEMGGGFGNAMAGTFVMVGIAAAIAAPVGIMAAIFLAVLGPDSKLGNACVCCQDVNGLPSILAGVFAYALVVMTTGTIRHRLAVWPWQY